MGSLSDAHSAGSSTTHTTQPLRFILLLVPPISRDLGALWIILFVAVAEGDGRPLAIVMNSRAEFAASWLTDHDGEERGCCGLLPGRLDEVLHVAAHVCARKRVLRVLVRVRAVQCKGSEEET